MKSKLLFIFALITSFCSMQAFDEEQIKVVTKATSLVIADVASYGVYSVQIGLSQLRGDKDREKRLQFCLWETQNFLKALNKAHTKEEIDAVSWLFAEQLHVCNKLVSTL